MANEFFTATSLGTMGGATGATVAVTNGLKAAFGWNPKWLGLVVAEVICLGTLAATGSAGLGGWIIAVLNGFLVFAAAAGATSAGNASLIGSNATPAPTGGSPGSAETSLGRFWKPWF
jgi:hypothetical protein